MHLGNVLIIAAVRHVPNIFVSKSYLGEQGHLCTL
jgi:hypothetical protein